jgi:hypothetical protein
MVKYDHHSSITNNWSHYLKQIATYQLQLLITSNKYSLQIDEYNMNTKYEEKKYHILIRNNSIISNYV